MELITTEDGTEGRVGYGVRPMYHGAMAKVRCSTCMGSGMVWLRTAETPTWQTSKGAFVTCLDCDGNGEVEEGPPLEFE